VPLGSFFSTVNAAFRAETWEDMSAEEREQVMRAVNLANAASPGAGATTSRPSRAPRPKRRGSSSSRPTRLRRGGAGVRRWPTATPRPSLSAERFGMDDASDRVAEFMELVEKWTAINEEVGDEPEAMAEAMWDEIWSQVDLSPPTAYADPPYGRGLRPRPSSATQARWHGRSGPFSERTPSSSPSWGRSACC
jgi:TRAP-type transport system periplasmic protein